MSNECDYVYDVHETDTLCIKQTLNYYYYKNRAINKIMNLYK